MYCIKCGKDVEIGIKNCPSCETEVFEELDEKQLKELSLTAHRRENEGYDNQQSALCHVVIGATLFIIGVLFLILSFKNVTGTRNKAFDLDGFEFWVSMASLLAGTILLTLGGIKLRIALKLKRSMKEIIEKLRLGLIK